MSHRSLINVCKPYVVVGVTFSRAQHQSRKHKGHFLLPVPYVTLRGTYRSSKKQRSIKWLTCCHWQKSKKRLNREAKVCLHWILSMHVVLMSERFFKSGKFDVNLCKWLFSRIWTCKFKSMTSWRTQLNLKQAAVYESRKQSAMKGPKSLPLMVIEAGSKRGSLQHVCKVEMVSVSIVKSSLLAV